MMDWRTWTFDQISNDDDILDDVEVEAIFGAGALEGDPSLRPFIALTFGREDPELNDGGVPAATSQRVSVYVHDTPGDYLRINRIMGNLRGLLAGSRANMSGGGITAQWEGDSDDLSDDIFGTIMRYGEYRLAGKVG